MAISVVVPVYNEQDSVTTLYEQLRPVLEGLETPWEVIFVDDGSTDQTAARLAELAGCDRRVKIIQFRKNYGQTAALQAGIQAASHQLIVTMDGDLQNDPADIPTMIEKLSEGYDVVNGWRRQRKDPWLSRRLPSRIANWIIAKATGVRVHDLGCTLRVMRAEIAKELELHGEMHRFIPILAHWRGARCAEVPTRHHPRRFGKTKYGIGRTFRVLLDLLTVKFMLSYFPSPMKLFGMIGLVGIAGGLASGTAAIAMKLTGGVDMTGNPLLLLCVLATMAGIQLLTLGLLGEVCVRIYYNGTDRQSFAVRRYVNFAPWPGPQPSASDKPAEPTHREAA